MSLCIRKSCTCSKDGDHKWSTTPTEHGPGKFLIQSKLY